MIPGSIVLETRLEIDEFSRGTRSKRNGVVVAIYFLFNAPEALQTLTADLQLAALGPMTDDKQPTLTDDC